MRRVIKKAFLFSFLIAGAVVNDIQSAKAQPAFYDSLSQMLTYFHTNAFNENVRTVLERAQNFASGNTINDSLAVQLKMLINQDMLLNDRKLLSCKVIPYGNFLIQILQHLTPKENRNDAAYLNRLAQVYHLLNKEDTALLLFKKASLLEEKQYGKKSLPYAICLYYMAGTCSSKENSRERSFALYQQAMSIIESTAGKDNGWYAKALEKLIWVYRDKLDYEKAHQCVSEALSIWEKITDKDNPDYISHVSDAALFYGYIYDYAAALQLCSEATRMTKDLLGEHHLQYVECLEDLGSAYYDIGYYENAMPCFQKCLSIQEELLGKNHRDNVLTLHNLATTYVRMGAYEKAMPLLENIVDRKLIDPNNREYYAYELNWQAYLYQLIGNYDKALPLYTQALQVTRETIGEETHRYALILKNVASLYQAKKVYPQAVTCLLKVLSITQTVAGENAPEYAIALNSLAELYKEMNKCDSALPLFTKALAIRKDKLGEAHPDYAASLNNLGEVYMQKGAYDSALNLLSQSLAISKKVLGEMHPDYIATLNNLGLVYLKTGNITAASALLIKANNLELKHILNTYTSLSEEEKLALINKEFYQFSYLPSLLMNAPVTQSNITQQIYLNVLSLKGMVLNDQQYVLKNIRASGDEQTLQLYYQWRSNKSIIGKELLLAAKQRLSNFDSLQQSTNELEQELSRRSAAFSNDQYMQQVSATDITHTMSAGEASVEFTRFKLYNTKWTDSILYAALILLPGDSIPKFIPLCEEKQLLPFIKSSENAAFRIYSSKIAGKKQSGTINDSLYSLIWKPLERYLDGIQTVYYAPVGLLNRIAFAALLYDGVHCLIDKYKLNQLLSTRSVSSCYQDAKPEDLSVWGNIQYDYESTAPEKEDYLVAKRGVSKPFYYYNSYLAEKNRNTYITKAWNELPGTKQEIDSIENIGRLAKLHVTIVSDTAATEEAFKALDGKSPQVIHIATHGFFIPAPEERTINSNNTNAFVTQKNAMFRSGLVLAGGNRAWKGEAAITGREDGILTAYEIAHLNLRNTDLVVLSACETADGDINSSEGVIGLQRAFKMAGVKQLIMSLWDVPDKQTAELMTLFYSNWIAGCSISEAFRLAQLNMEAKYPPYYWAAFVLVK